MKAFRKNIILSLCFLLVLGMFLFGCADEDLSDQNGDEPSEGQQQGKETIYLRMAGSTVGGVWYPAAASLMDWVAREMWEVADLRTAVIPGGGTLNPTQVQELDAEIAWTMNIFTYASYRGLFPYEEPHEDIQLVASFQPNPVLLVVAADSDIYSWADLADKRVGVQPLGTGGQLTAQIVLESYGITQETVQSSGGRLEYVDLSTMVDMMKDRQLDALACPGMPGSSWVQDINYSYPVRIVGIPEDDVWNKISGQFLEYYLEPGVGDLQGQTERVRLPAMTWQIIANRTVSEEVIYQFLKGLENNLEDFKNISPSYDQTAIEDLGVSQEVPFHPGAVRYYEENNIKMGVLVD